MEVHLYTPDILSDTSYLSVPLSSVYRVDVYTYDAKEDNEKITFYPQLA